MKCLSVSQPFADLIVSGKKTVELRRWNTKYRGLFLVHAPLRILKSDCRRLKIRKRPVTGAIIGRAEIYDVKRYSSAREVRQDRLFHLASTAHLGDRYGFLLRDARPLRVPIPYKGRLGLFEVELPGGMPRQNEIQADVIDEDYRYQWIGRH